MEAALTRSSAGSRTVGRKPWTARILGTLLVLFLLLDVAGKLLRLPPYVEGTVRVGYPAALVVPLGLVLLGSILLYVVPRTAFLGAILLTGYFGGAVATHVRMGEPFWLPVVFGVIVWGCLYFRDERLRALLPVVRPREPAERS